MKLSDQYLGELRTQVAGPYADAIEELLSFQCKFDALVDCFRKIEPLVEFKLMPLNDRYNACVKNLKERIKNINLLDFSNFKLRQNLKAELRSLQKFNILAEFTKTVQLIYKSRGITFANQPISEVLVRKTSVPTDKSKLTLFNNRHLHKTDYCVTLRDGKHFQFHTLYEGKALDKAREIYNHKTKECFIDISRTTRHRAKR